MRSPSGRRKLLWFSALAILATLAWYFFPGPPRARLSWERLDLGTVRVGESGDETLITVTNEGERSLRIKAISVTEDAAGDYEWADEGCIGEKLVTGESCLVRLWFRPKAAGRRSGSVVFDSNARKQAAVAVDGLAVAPQLGLAPSTMAFGVVPLEGEAVSRKVTLSNVGSAPLEFRRIRIDGESRGDFSRSRRCPSSRLAPGEACSFEIRFKPTVSGPRRATLIVESDALGDTGELALEGTGLWEGPPLDPSSAHLDLGEQLVGQRASPVTVTFVNRTGGPVSVTKTSIVDGTPFAMVEDSCLGREVGSGASCSISMTFLPVRDGPIDASLLLSAAGASEESRVDLKGRGVTPGVEAEVSSVNFQNQRVGFESALRNVRFTNTGTATLTFKSSAVTGRDGTDFLLRTNGCVGKVLEPGKTCDIGLGFSPSVRGDRTAVFFVDPGFDLTPLRIRVSGKGVVSSLRVNPGRLDFGNVYLGQLEDLRLTLSNAGSARLDIAGLRFEGDDAKAFRIGSMGCALDSGIAAGGSCTFEIDFEPESAKSYRASFVLAYNGPDSPAKVQLYGVGRVPAPVFRISATSLDLGSARLGGRGEIGTVTISNPGAAWLDLTSVSLRGDHAEDFQLVAGTCDGVTALAPSGSCTVGVRLAPGSAGARRGTIVVRHGGDGGVANVALTGVGLQ